MPAAPVARAVDVVPAAEEEAVLWVAACDAVPPLAGEPDVCALVLVVEEVVEEAVEEEEPDVATAVVAAGMPAFVVVVVTTCGASRTSATVPANGRLSIASISNLTCEPGCTPPTSPSGTSASSRIRRRSPMVKRTG